MSRDNKKIATLWDNKGSNDDHEHPEGQAFYAGGSEHSGQQILGPSRDGPESGRFVENLFTHARQFVIDPNDPSQRNAAASGTTLPITFWRNGFTVGEDGELREYTAPDNRQFIDCLRRGETPPELASQLKGGRVKLENKAQQDYKPERKLHAFSGEGYRLGAPSPEMVESEQQSSRTTEPGQNEATSGLKPDESQPMTTIQIRLVDNSRLVVRVNLTHNVGDLMSHVRAMRPQYSNSNFVLATTFPAKELTDLEQTIEDAKLANASVLQKIKRQ